MYGSVEEGLGFGIMIEGIETRADATLLESYLKQAMYEEKQQHWNESARSWIKAAKLKDDAETHGRTAHAILKSDELRADVDTKMASGQHLEL